MLKNPSHFLPDSLDFKNFDFILWQVLLALPQAAETENAEMDWMEKRIYS